MDKATKQFIGLFCTLITILIALGNLALMEDLPAYRLILTSEGCAYAQSIALPVEKSSGQCSVEARFQPYAISSGGMLHLNSDKKIAVTGAMLLATVQTDTKFPSTPMQRARLKWFWIWLSVATVIGSTTAIYWKIK